jgi:DNA ligase D-like protein (predicted ligase)
LLLGISTVQACAQKEVLMKRSAKELPKFIRPMLAKPGVPFDSDDYLFEIKWDGTRTLAFIDRSGYRLVNRRQVDMTSRYPEFSFLGQIKPGTVVDGEVVVLRRGKPDFRLLMSREQTQSSLKIRNLARTLPATYIVFDLLYDGYESVIAQPLQVRRERLQQLVKQCDQPHLVLSEGIVGKGKAFFREACAQELEGVIAKRLQSRYMPDQRTDAWIKIKRGETVCCAIIGFLPSGKDDFRSLILAAERGGVLHHVGQVGSGFDMSLRKKLNALVWSRLRAKPIIPCKIKGKWIEPGLYCLVHCMERTASGHLRAPSFKELLEG